MKRVTRTVMFTWALVAAAGLSFAQNPPPDPPDDRPPYGEPAQPPRPNEPAATPQNQQQNHKAEPGPIDCKMEFNLHGWSAIYRTAEGDGTITCDNGETRKVDLKIKGGGLSFGKSDVVNGTGRFTKVKNIDQLFGAYAAGEAHAGAGGSANAQALTKGKVSLTLVGTGQGVDLGLDLSRFVIKPAEENKKQKEEKHDKKESSGRS
jgi:hypothetical protein